MQVKIFINGSVNDPTGGGFMRDHKDPDHGQITNVGTMTRAGDVILTGTGQPSPHWFDLPDDAVDQLRKDAADLIAKMQDDGGDNVLPTNSGSQPSVIVDSDGCAVLATVRGWAPLPNWK